VWISKKSLDGTGDYFDMGYYDWETGIFTPFEGSVVNQMYDSNENFYASKTFYDPVENRRVLWGWLRMFPWPDDDETFSVWECAQSVPRLVDFVKHDDGTYSGVNYPVKEIQSLRIKESNYQFEQSYEANSSTTLSYSGRMLDIEANLTATGTGMQCGFRVLQSNDDDGVEVLTPVGDGETVPMRILVDASIVEAFFGATPVTTFKLDVTQLSAGVSILSQQVGSTSGTCTVSASMWNMKPFVFDVSRV